LKFDWKHWKNWKHSVYYNFDVAMTRDILLSIIRDKPARGRENLFPAKCRRVLLLSEEVDVNYTI